MDSALYVDDVCYRSKYFHTIECQLKVNMDKSKKWATMNSFWFSKSKTWGVHFYSLWKMHNSPVIKLEGTKILIDEYKFLGVIFDKKLSFNPSLETPNIKMPQLLQVMAHTEWRADQQTLLKLYSSQVQL